MFLLQAMQEEGINTYESYRDLLSALMREFTEHESFYSPFMLDGWQIQLVKYCVCGAFNSEIGDLVIYGLSNLTGLPCKVVTEGCNKVPYIHVVTPDRLNKTDVHDGSLLLLLTSLHYEPLVKMVSDSFELTEHMYMKGSIRYTQELETEAICIFMGTFSRQR